MLCGNRVKTLDGIDKPTGVPACLLCWSCQLQAGSPGARWVGGLRHAGAPAPRVPRLRGPYALPPAGSEYKAVLKLLLQGACLLAGKK